MKKILKVKIIKNPINTHSYDYEYEESKGYKIKGEAMPSIEYIEKEIEKRMKNLYADRYIIKIEKEIK